MFYKRSRCFESICNDAFIIPFENYYFTVTLDQTTDSVFRQLYFLPMDVDYLCSVKQNLQLFYFCHILTDAQWSEFDNFTNLGAKLDLFMVMQSNFSKMHLLLSDWIVSKMSDTYCLLFLDLVNLTSLKCFVVCLVDVAERHCFDVVVCNVSLHTSACGICYFEG